MSEAIARVQRGKQQQQFEAYVQPTSRRRQRFLDELGYTERTRVATRASGKPALRVLAHADVTTLGATIDVGGDLSAIDVGRAVTAAYTVCVSELSTTNLERRVKRKRARERVRAGTPQQRYIARHRRCHGCQHEFEVSDAIFVQTRRGTVWRRKYVVVDGKRVIVHRDINACLALLRIFVGHLRDGRRPREFVSPHRLQHSASST